MASNMRGIKFNSLVILFYAFASILPTLRANFAEFDEFWQRRAAEAWNRTLESYEPEPHKIVSHWNMNVHRIYGSIMCRRQIAVDAIMGSTGITISNGHFTVHDEASDSHSQDEIMQITVAFNHFGKRMVQVQMGLRPCREQ